MTFARTPHGQFLNVPKSFRFAWGLCVFSATSSILWADTYYVDGLHGTDTHDGLAPHVIDSQQGPKKTWAWFSKGDGGGLKPGNLPRHSGRNAHQPALPGLLWQLVKWGTSNWRV